MAWLASRFPPMHRMTRSLSKPASSWAPTSLGSPPRSLGRASKGILKSAFSCRHRCCPRLVRIQCLYRFSPSFTAVAGQLGSGCCVHWTSSFIISPELWGTHVTLISSAKQLKSTIYEKTASAHKLNLSKTISAFLGCALRARGQLCSYIAAGEV